MKTGQIILKKVYHFVSTMEMRKKLFNYSKKKDWPVSKTIVYIIHTMMPLLNYFFYFKPESSDFSYDKFGAEVEIKFLIEKNMYRKLKNIQGSMQTFSVAVIIRKMINIFFKYVDKRSIKYLKRIINKIGNRSLNKFKNAKFQKKKYYELHMYDDESTVGCINLLFSKNFTLLGIEPAT